MRIRVALVLGVAALSFGCGSSDEESSKTCSVHPLDPAGTHYGKTYGEWSEAWVKWLFEIDPTAQCIDPVGDPTGAQCAHGQDPNSPVFFLAGTWGGTAVRTECVVPKDKALFFPVANFISDCSMASPGEPCTDEELKQTVEAWAKGLTESSMSVDGCSLGKADPYYVLAKYSVTIPAEPNFHSCLGNPGVEGPFSGWTAGYYVLLPPLDSGVHKLHFDANVKAEPDLFVIDIRYDPLAVE